MTVNVDSAKHSAEHHGTQYYFCGVGCRATFLTDPESYLTEAPPTAQHHRMPTISAPSDRGARQ